MSQKLIVKKNHGTCPCCNTQLRVITPKTGEGSVDQYPKIENITKGYKKEIIDAYLRHPEKEYTTQRIIDQMNITRRINSVERRVQRCNITRAHGELVGRRIILKLRKEDSEYVFKIDEPRARAWLKGKLA